MWDYRVAYSGDTPLHVAGKEMKPNVFGFLLLVSTQMVTENLVKMCEVVTLAILFAHCV